MINIDYYITYQLNEPNIAEKMISNINKKILLLKDFPHIGRKFDNQKRVLIHKNYLILYKIQENENLISIVRVLYARKNYLS